MNKRIIFASVVTSAILVALPVLAETEVSVSASTTVSRPGKGMMGSTTKPWTNGSSTEMMERKAGATGTASSTMLENAKKRALMEIDRRIEGLNRLNERSEDMKRVSDAAKAGLSAQVQAEITALQALKVKIQADTDMAMLKADIMSITGSYRIYALIIPQGHILVAADRIIAISNAMTTIAGKLQTRMTAAETAGKNIIDLQKSLGDLMQKVADAQIQAAAATSSISALVPDQGDTAKFQANKKLLIEAQAKIKLGHEDLQTARRDAQAIINALRAFGLDTASSTLKMKDVNAEVHAEE